MKGFALLTGLFLAVVLFFPSEVPPFAVPILMYRDTLMESQISPEAVRVARTLYPNCYLSGSGDRWAVLRFMQPGRASLVFFATQGEARELAARTGDRVVEVRIPVPKIPKHREAGIRMTAGRGYCDFHATNSLTRIGSKSSYPMSQLFILSQRCLL